MRCQAQEVISLILKEKACHLTDANHSAVTGAQGASWADCLPGFYDTIKYWLICC